jgi:hypothetical protein
MHSHPRDAIIPAGAGMKESVYIETTIVSYLVARVSRRIGLAGDQAATRIGGTRSEIASTW